MVSIVFPPTSVPAIQAEIERIDAQIQSLVNDVTFFTEQLNGKPAEMMFSDEEIEQNPYLSAEQKVLFPPTIGALSRDSAYADLLFTQAQPIIDKYEAERRLVDGLYPNFTIDPPYGPGSGLFDENLIQQSGVHSVGSLFNPAVSITHLANPGEMFGGTGADINNEVAKIDVELAKITTLLTGTCQAFPPIPMACQNARLDLENALKARFDPSGPSGLLIQEEAALAANPDLALFVSNPSAAVAAEKVRIQSFLTTLAAVPFPNPVPPALLTVNQAAATARKTYIQSTRIPEMGGFLNTNPGYYSIRFGITDGL